MNLHTNEEWDQFDEYISFIVNDSSNEEVRREAFRALTLSRLFRSYYYRFATEKDWKKAIDFIKKDLELIDKNGIL